ncbi:MAG TPA: RNA methyltransferase [Polyangiaceae bacterium]|nr:RNA methyltransferase [Polyangiaceae bacterium]
MLVLPLTRATRFVLVGPHYPENVGAAARAIKTMGITELVLVNPGRLARPENEMAFKMAVRAWDVLESAQVVDDLASALRGVDCAFGTTARRGQSGILNPRDAARKAHEEVQRGQRIAVVLGNEKTGLTHEELARCQQRIRIPMAADQPSINLAQACQLLAYEWFMTALEQRRKSGAPDPESDE